MDPELPSNPMDAGPPEDGSGSNVRTTLSLEDQVLRSSVKAKLFNVAESVRIDRYTVLGYVGAGGMGVVYSAYDTELDRKVALKLLQADQPHDRGQERLKREAQAMAKLSHPNVVQIYEVGEHDGRVYLAMEFVQGSTLRRWLAEGDRSWREILDKFLEAGRGLAAAHRVGLIHRDFKPDNVLVGPDGRVLVTDFGMARAAEDVMWSAEEDDSADTHSPGSTLAQRLTRTGAILGTPAYMSPEQHQRQPTDARSDQFSFCVALYEALYEELPFIGTSRASLALSVVEGKFRPPPRRPRVPSRVRRALLRGMAVAPESRHASMDALLAELARRPAARHFTLMAGAAAIAAALAVPPLLLAEDPCAKAGDDLAAVWNDGRREKVDAAFQKSGLAYAEAMWTTAAARLDKYSSTWRDARRSSCEASHVHHTQSDRLLDLQSACLERSKQELDVLLSGLETGEPERLTHALEMAEGLPDVRRCNDAAVLLGGPGIPNDPGLRGKIAAVERELAEGRNLIVAGRYEDANVVLEPLAHRAELLGHEPTLAEVLYELGHLCLRQGQPACALEALHRAVDLAEGSRADGLAARAWTQIAYVSAVDIGQLEDADQALRRAAVDLRRSGHASEADAHQVSVHAEVLRQRGEFALAAEKLERRIVAEAAENHSSARLKALRTQLGRIRFDQGDYDGARREFESAQAMLQQLLGSAHPDNATLKIELGMVEQRANRSERAAALFQQAIDSTGVTPSTQVQGRMGLFELAQNRGDLEEARHQVESAMALMDKAYRHDPRQRANLLGNLGTLLFYEGNHAEALNHYEQAIAIHRSLESTNNVELAKFQSNRGDALVALSRFPEAEDAYRDALRTMEKQLPHDALPVAFALKGLAQSLIGQGRQSTGAALLERALTIHSTESSMPAEAADVRWTFAQVLHATDPSRARKLAQEALRYYSQSDGTDATKVRAIEHWMRSLPPEPPGGTNP